MATHNLKGKITDPNNNPLAKLSVRASAADKVLGETSTDQNGAYHISYPAKQVAKGARIQVDVFDALGRRIGQGEVVVPKATSKLDLVVEIEQYAPTAAFTAALQQDLAEQKRISMAMDAVGKTTKSALSPTVSQSSALAVLPKIAPFLEANPDFDLLEQNVDTFLDTQTTSTRALDAAETNDALNNLLEDFQKLSKNKRGKYSMASAATNINTGEVNAAAKLSQKVPSTFCAEDLVAENLKTAPSDLIYSEPVRPSTNETRVFCERCISKGVKLKP